MRYIILFYLFAGIVAHSQYWQQEIDYKIEVNFDKLTTNTKVFRRLSIPTIRPKH